MTLQPWLHDHVTVLRAPTAALSAPDGQLHPGGADGVLHGDHRVLSHAVLRIDGEQPTAIAHGLQGADRARFTAIARSLGDAGPDPTVRIDRTRTARPSGVSEEILLTSTAAEPVRCELTLEVAADFVTIAVVKSGRPTTPVPYEPAHGDDGVVRWHAGGLSANLHAPGAQVRPGPADGVAVLAWSLTLDPGRPVSLHWHVEFAGTEGPVTGVDSPDPWTEVTVRADEHRLAPLLRQSLADLGALRMSLTARPEDEFLAAGSPWYFTLFGRDSIWAARLMLPFGTDIAAGTLRALASLQGQKVDEQSAEQPGKIPHELRGTDVIHEGETRAARTMHLPPLYYGTIDATPLWICLLHDAWRWGMPDEEIRALLPALRAALAWLRDYGDADGDGFLEYLDTTGTGLANQGWKDSGDSIRFADGVIADDPVALCEVQGYAYEAAIHGADLLEAFGEPGAEEWRAWAAILRRRFHEAFWVDGPSGRFPALALDGSKRPVDSLTSNIGHLFGTGILDPEDSARLAELITGPELASGFGLRTMATTDGGYSPLSYHCGSVWPHDTAIAVRGLAADGHHAQALRLIEGLLATGTGFDYRVPELLSGDAADTISWPVPYPASCRPQAWSAAAVGAIIEALLGLRVDVPAGSVLVGTGGVTNFGAIEVTGLRAGERALSVSIDRDGRASIVER